MRKSVLAFIFNILGGLVLLFLIAPLVKIFISVMPQEYFETIRDPEVNRSIGLTLWVSLASTLVFALGAGTGLAWLLNMMNPVFTDEADLRETTGLPVLGSVSTTWVERQQRVRVMQFASFSMAGGVLVVVFVLVFLLREPGGALVRQLLSGAGA